MNAELRIAQTDAGKAKTELEEQSKSLSVERSRVTNP